MKFSPQLCWASGWYGMYAYGRLAPLCVVTLCHAHHDVPNPLIERPDGVNTITVAPTCAAAGMPNLPAAYAASPAIADWVGLEGTAFVASTMTPFSWPIRFWMCVPADPQLTVPRLTPWQYCASTPSQLDPPTFVKKSWMYCFACAFVNESP